MKTFKIDLKEEIVQIGNEQFVVREFTGVARNAYMQELQSRTTDIVVDGKPAMDDKGRPVRRLTNVSGLESKLVSLCLFTRQGQPVAQEVIDVWPASVVTELATLASAINQLDIDPEKRESVAKNV